MLPTDLCGNWCDAHENRLESLKACPLPRDGAAWAGDWVQDLAGTRDAQGWQFARNFALSEWQLEMGKSTVVRRRAWVRAYVVGYAAAAAEKQADEAAAAAAETVSGAPAPAAETVVAEAAERAAEEREAAERAMASQPTILPLAPGQLLLHRPTGEAGSSLLLLEVRPRLHTRPPLHPGHHSQTP